MKQCKQYCGVACVDGTCPAANREKYEEQCIPIVRNWQRMSPLQRL